MDFLVKPTTAERPPALVVAVRRATSMPSLLKTDVEDLTDDRAPCAIFVDSLKMHRAATVHFNLRTWLCLEARKKNKPLHLDDTTAFSKDHLPLVVTDPGRPDASRRLGLWSKNDQARD
ncbi:hypothetical protein CTAYLR_000146 [Chrysophaeum taylorii]|uniref:Uncharacterized protein n=1 Tax=Chrysophaeum taylorii TaxID=2483200 RepID=A0AAD7UGS1_9STRA|nr:hypothetical protein CTAYLR_000146 [Chrysophaeum taylorii]